MGRKRDLKCGVGINDADYTVTPVVDGKRISCPYYTRWGSMLVRCYSEKSQAHRPTYRGVVVCDEWKRFSVFKEWMIKQDWVGKHLDKDIVVTGNKIYSPHTCIFVTGEINALLTGASGRRGKHPIGVSYDKNRKKYAAHVRINNNLKHLGCFDSPEEASKVFLAAKADYVREVALKQEPFLRSCLERIAGEIERGEYYD